MSDLPLFVWVPDDDGGYDIWALDACDVPSPVTLSPEREARLPDCPVHGEDALPSGLAAGQDDPGTLRKVAELSARLRDQYGEPEWKP